MANIPVIIFGILIAGLGIGSIAVSSNALSTQLFNVYNTAFPITNGVKDAAATQIRQTNVPGIINGLALVLTGTCLIFMALQPPQMIGGRR